MNDSSAESLDVWESAPVSHWRDRWRLPHLVILANTTSTNDVLRRLAEDGADAGTVVMAESQTAGRGQEARRWVAPPGKALLISVLLRGASRLSRPIDPGTAPVRVGLALCRAIPAVTNVDVRIKWPNDIVHAGRKLAGILCEGATGSRGAFVVAGIGLNVLQNEHDWPDDLRAPATSLLLLTGHAISRAAIAEALLGHLRPFRLTGRALDEETIARYGAVDAVAGLPITVNGVAAGIAAGIAPDGALVVQTRHGTRTIRAGTVRIAGASTQSHGTT